MSNNKYWAVLFLIFLDIFKLNAQADSLWNELREKVRGMEHAHTYQTLFDYYYNYENDSALIVAEKYLEFAESVDSDSLQVVALVNIGIYYDVYKSDLEKSLKFYHKAYNLAYENRLSNLKDVCHYIGVIFHVNDEYENAKFYYMKAIELSTRSGGDNSRLIGSSINLASIYSKQSEFELAEEIFAEVLENDLSEELGLKAYALSNLANLYIRKSAFRKAIPLLREAYSINLKLEDYRARIQLIDYLMEAKVGLNDDNGLDSLVTKMQEFATKTDNLRILSLVYESLADTYFFMGKYKDAYEASKKHLTYYDERESAEKEELLFELEAKYQNELKQNEINQLKIESQEAEIDASKRSNQLVLLLCVSSLLLLTGLFFVSRFLQKNKSNKLLADKNEKIKIALDEKEVLLKEIHHRVKNNLQVISSLLKLQEGSLSEDAAVEAIRDGQLRVKSMSLIHQKLYQEDDLRGVDVHDYLVHLVPELIASFQHPNREIEYELELNELKLDIDTLVPLGLIINELITNSLKHAFEEVENGLIRVRMEEKEEQLLVSISDNGSGIEKKLLETSNSFGWKMINSLARKLKAEFNVSSTNGTHIEIAISRYKLVL